MVCWLVKTLFWIASVVYTLGWNRSLFMLRHNSTLITDTIYRTVSLIFPKARLIEHTVHSTFTAVKSERTVSFHVILFYCATFSNECGKKKMYWLKINDCTNSVARVDFIHDLKRLCCMLTVLEWNNFHQHIQSLHNVLEKTNKPQSFCLYLEDAISISSLLQINK